VIVPKVLRPGLGERDQRAVPPLNLGGHRDSVDDVPNLLQGRNARRAGRLSDPRLLGRKVEILGIRICNAGLVAGLAGEPDEEALQGGQGSINGCLAQRLTASVTSLAGEIALILDVRFGSKADICSAKRHVRFTPESGHQFVSFACPLCANSGLMHRSKRHRYSITSSALASRLAGMVSPSALAVLRLITSLNLVGAWTGKLAGFSPLRIRST
jgi:hypothetical protein